MNIYGYCKNILLCVYIMALIVSSYSGTRNLDSITNRTAQSGGSIGGVKKAGTWGGNVYMNVNNIGNAYTWRIPQKMSTIRQLYLFTTRFPVQFNRNSYAATHRGV